MSKYPRVQHKNCKGGNGVKEIDGKTYCYGRLDARYEYEYLDECTECPRFIYNNIEDMRGEE